MYSYHVKLKFLLSLIDNILEHILVVMLGLNLEYLAFNATDIYFSCLSRNFHCHKHSRHFFYKRHDA